MISYQQVTKEDRELHWQKNLMSELSLPFSPQSHQYCLWLLNQCSRENYKKLENLVYKRFYNSRPKSRQARLIPQSI